VKLNAEVRAKISATLKGKAHSEERIAAIRAGRRVRYPSIQPGHRFGRWTVVEDAPSASRQRRYLCACDCGNRSIVSATHLRRGNSTGCTRCQGKKKSERAIKNNRLPDGSWRYVAGGVKRGTWIRVILAEMFQKQSGVCPICLKKLKSDFSDGCLDHDHVTGIVRALVHRGCNVLIGWFERDSEIVGRVRDYLGGTR